jgi:toxin ParE1/3/4
VIPVILLDAALEEMFAGSDFYNAREKGLGDEFIDAIEHTRRLLSEYPHLGARIKRGMRRFVMARFPYSLIYRVHADLIVVVAIKHHAQEEDYWLGRL